MTTKTGILSAVWLVSLCPWFAYADIQSISTVLVTVSQGNPQRIWLQRVWVQDYSVQAEHLITGTSAGVATAALPPYNDITNADNLDLNLFAARNNEEPSEWCVTNLGGQELYRDGNGGNPDFFLFETNGNDDIVVQAILPDGSLGQGIVIPKATWADTGLRITASVHRDQKIMGLSWALTDLLDGQGQALAPSQAIAGIQITSSGLDPACFCAVAGTTTNQAPVVDAGEDVVLFLPDSVATLIASATDDGLGQPDGTLSYHWSLEEGPGGVVFEPDASVLSPAVTLLGGPGAYVLELLATDGALYAWDQVIVYLRNQDAISKVMINELLADSSPESQEPEDWIELYNPGEFAVDSAGYHLTDNLEEPIQWRVPGGDPSLTTIPARGFLRIWADAGYGAGLHANFRLDSAGETLGLFGPDGLTEIDRVTFDKLPAGIAWGREADGGDRWVTLDPSPGRSNAGYSLPLVADTKFSVDRGFFDTPFDVTITCATPGATIVYTTDGSVPTPSHGVKGSSSVRVSINTTTIVRAMAYKESMNATDVDTQTYLFLTDVIHQPADIPGYPRPWTWMGGSVYDYHDYEMDPAIVDHPDYRDEIVPALLAIPTMSIAVEPSQLAEGKGFYWGSSETLCSVEILFPDDPNDNVRANAGIEPHSHNRLKRSMRLNFRAEFGDAKLKTKLIEKGSLFGDTATDTFDRLILRGGNNRCWARAWNADKTAYTVDQFYRDLQVALSGYGSRGTFVHLYINGLYWGLYNPSERTDQWFTSAYFGGEPEDWFAIHHQSSGINGDSQRYTTLMNDLIKRDQSNADTYALTCQYIDTENFCDYMLFAWWMGVGDWPGNNWYAGCRTDSSPLGPTPLRFFAWDGEWSWDAPRGGGVYGRVHSEFQNNKSGGSEIPRIWHALRRNDDFMLLFADRVYRHLFNGGALTDDVAQQRWLRINEQLRGAVVAESARWGDALKNQGQPTRTRDEDWQREVDSIYGLIEGNSQRFVDDLRQQGYYPMIDPPVFSSWGGAVVKDYPLLLTNPNASGIVYYSLDGSDPRLGIGMVEDSILLPCSCTVKTRVRDGSTWSAINEAIFTVGPVVESLRVSEIMYHPQDNGHINDPNTEYIELINVGSETINLNLVRFTNGITFTFPVHDLVPGAKVLVVKDFDAFSAKYGSGLPVVGDYQGSLDNAGERITLVDAIGQAIHDFTYKDGWYKATDGQGCSLEIKDLLATTDLNNKATWQPSSEVGGTPGW